MEYKIKISFVGAGNVATHLAKALHQQNYKIEQIFSRTLVNAEILANQVNARPINDLNKLKDIDLVILSVPDDILPSIYKTLKDYKSVLAHTSGVSDLDFLTNIENARVAYFYPLQTFKKNSAIDLKRTPFFVNARFEEDKSLLISIANTISDNVKVINNNQKKQLHLSAVVVNNFVNHLFGLTKENLKKNNLDLSDLKPIIDSTIQRAIAENPFNVQTGPAIRNDKQTIKKHLELLKGNEEFEKIYRCFSESIYRKHNS